MTHSRRTLWSRSVLSMVAGAIAIAASPAQASPLFETAGDTQGMSGLQARTLPAGAAATYFNPALLADTPAGVSFGISFISSQISIGVDGRPGPEFDVPAGVENAGHADFSRFDNYPIPTELLENGREATDLKPAFQARPRQGAGTGQQTTAYASVGMVLKLFDDNLALGFHALLPLGDFMKLKLFYPDEREQYFSNSLHPELYSDRLTAPSIAVGAGVRLLPGLSLGVSVGVIFAADVAASAYVVDTSDLSNILIDMDGGASVGFAPQFGVTYALLDDRLRFSAVAHAPTEVEVDTEFQFLISNGLEQASGFKFLLFYRPWTASLGASFDFLPSSKEELSVAASLLYANWYQYLDRHGERPPEAYPWLDTLSPTFGVRYGKQRFLSHADVAYIPSPVPDQTGRTNFVDNDKVSTSLGGEIGFDLWNTGLAVGLVLNMQRLLPRYQAKLPTPTDSSGEDLAPELIKDEIPDDAQISGEPLEGREGLQTNNPGWPGFGSQGWLFGGSVYLKVAI